MNGLLFLNSLIRSMSGASRVCVCCVCVIRMCASCVYLIPKQLPPHEGRESAKIHHRVMVSRRSGVVVAILIVAAVAEVTALARERERERERSRERDKEREID